MNFIDRTLATFGYTKSSRIEAPPSFLSGYSEQNRWFEPDSNKTETQNTIYSRVSWVLSAVNMVASVAATTPLKVKERSDSGDEDIDNHPFENLLFKPNPTQSRHEFLYATMAWYLITGNCYWWLNKASEDAEPDELWIVPTQAIRPVPSSETFVRGYMYDPGNGIEVPIDADQIVHFKSFNPHNLYVGLSLMEGIYNTTTHDYKATEWNKNFFAKDNAKPTGALVFGDTINSTTWDMMKRDVETQYGGTKRRLLMMQGAGQKSVNYIPMMLTQAEMQFIESRKFNRDEIFNAIAPGSAAMVDVNATEANSKTGRDVFFSIGVHPRLDFLAQKITSELLPYYGDDLTAKFDDVRQRDVALELQQISTYSQYHTIAEVRQEWFNGQPIGDERDDLLVAEIGQAATKEDEPEEPKQEVKPDTELLDEIKAVLASIKASVHPAVHSVNVEPTTVTIHQSSPDVQYEIAETKQIDQPEETEPTAAEIDLGKWQTKAQNRAKKERSIAVDFESEHLPSRVKALVGLGLARGDMSVFDSAKMILQLDPDDDEAEQKAREGLENSVVVDIQRALENQRRAISEFFRDESTFDFQDFTDADLTPSQEELEFELRKALDKSVDLGVSVAIQQFENVGLAFDWTLANAEAREWAAEYSGELISGIQDTTLRRVRTSTSTWIDSGETIDTLIDDLSSVFSYQRAELIAGTEVTKAYAEGSRIAYVNSGVISEMEWRTANDERVCPICSRLGGLEYNDGSSVPAGLDDQNGVRASLEGGFIHPGGNGASAVFQDKTYRLPPAHPRCRCWIVPVI